MNEKLTYLLIAMAEITGVQPVYSTCSVYLFVFAMYIHTGVSMVKMLIKSGANQ